MKIVLFGATGRTGRQVLDQAIQAGHEVTAVVRDPTSLPQQAHLSVVVADVMKPDAIGPHLAGQDAVVTAIGPRRPTKPTTVQADSTASIIAAMHGDGTRRLVAVSNSGILDTGDGPVTRYLAKPILRRVFRHTWGDMRRMEALVRASDLDWTILRPPMLTDGRRTGSYRTANESAVRGGIRLSRADLADGILRALAEPKFIGAAVALAN
jgi:putative NADH-flavin reductase